MMHRQSRRKQQLLNRLSVGIYRRYRAYIRSRRNLAVDSIDAIPHAATAQEVQRSRAIVAIRRRTVLLAVSAASTLVALVGAGGYVAGISVERHHSAEALMQSRIYYSGALESARETWASRDVCEAQLSAQGTETHDKMLGFFPSAKLQECYKAQELRVARYNSQAHRGGDD